MQRSIYFVIIMITILFACQGNRKENKNESIIIDIQHLQYAPPSPSDDSDGPRQTVVYDICTFVHEDTVLVLAEIQPLSLIPGGVCEGSSHYSRNAVKYQLRIIDSFLPSNVPLDVSVVDIGGLIVSPSNYQPGDFGLFSLRRVRDEWFVKTTLKIVSTTTYSDRHENVVVRLPESVDELRLQFETAMENIEENCPNITMLSSEEWDRYAFGDPESCPIPDPESTDPCLEKNPPPCCYDDTIPETEEEGCK